MPPSGSIEGPGWGSLPVGDMLLYDPLDAASFGRLSSATERPLSSGSSRLPSGQITPRWAGVLPAHRGVRHAQRC